MPIDENFVKDTIDRLARIETKLDQLEKSRRMLDRLLIGLVSAFVIGMFGVLAVVLPHM